MFSLRKRQLILHSVLMADLKAAKKTVNLYTFMSSVFDDVYLTENHSKVLLIENDRWMVTVFTSQNQTRGNRTECAMITTQPDIFLTLRDQFSEIINTRSLHLNGIHFNTD